MLPKYSTKYIFVVQIFFFIFYFSPFFLERHRGARARLFFVLRLELRGFSGKTCFSWKITPFLTPFLEQLCRRVLCFWVKKGVKKVLNLTQMTQISGISLVLIESGTVELVIKHALTMSDSKVTTLVLFSSSFSSTLRLTKITSL